MFSVDCKILYKKVVKHFTLKFLVKHFIKTDSGFSLAHMVTRSPIWWARQSMMVTGAATLMIGANGLVPFQQSMPKI